MSNSYMGEIRLFAGTFAPAGWMFCQGQILPISEYDALFNLIGTTYGGDGQETFALPNMSSRFPLGVTSGYALGAMAGVESVTLTTQQIPLHSHPMLCNSGPATDSNPQNNVYAEQTGVSAYTDSNPNPDMATGTITLTGGSQPHENMVPYLGMNFIISLYGVYPQQG